MEQQYRVKFEKADGDVVSTEWMSYKEADDLWNSLIRDAKNRRISMPIIEGRDAELSYVGDSREKVFRTEEVEAGVGQKHFSDEKITVNRKEYEDLQKESREYKLFLEANQQCSYPLSIKRCAEPGCKAISVTDCGRGIDVYHGCENIVSCDFQTDCWLRDDNVQYCDKHVNNFLIAKSATKNSEDTIFACKKCWESYVKKVKEGKRDLIEHWVLS